MRFKTLATGATAAAISCTGALHAQSVAGLFERVAPSVVEIVVQQTAIPAQGDRKRTTVGGLGSGFLISDDGLIMTAAHVVQAADKVAVRFASGALSDAQIVASAPYADVALIRAEKVPPDISPLVLGDSDTAAVGDRVVVVGAPFGFSSTLTVGHVSARRQPKEMFGGLTPVDLLQTDASINQGNSGGPMFNMDGEVIGIVSHILSLSGGFEGLGFVITSNLANRLLIEERSWWSGFEGYMLEGELARIFNLPQPRGILVENVAAGSPASVLGIQPGKYMAVIGDQQLVVGGDILLKVQGIEIGPEDSFEKIRQVMLALTPEDRLSMVVLRGGQIVRIEKYAYLFK